MNWDYYESVDRSQRILDAQGISESLKENGAKEGDLVMIGTYKYKGGRREGEGRDGGDDWDLDAETSLNPLTLPTFISPH